MAVTAGALSLLGESVDWLKDSDGVSLSEYRLRVVDRMASCWRHPEDGQRFAAFEENLILLFQGLFFNKLYPGDMFFVHTSAADPRNFLPRADHLVEDAEKLDAFCRHNRLGMGEVHFLYVATALCRRVFQDAFDAGDIQVERRLGEWLAAQAAAHTDPSVGRYGDEVFQRYRGLCAMRVMQQHGLSDDNNDSQLPAQERLKLMDRLVPLGAEGMSRYCPRTHWLPMLVLEFMTAVGEHCLAVAESRSCRESRSADDVTKGLLHCMRQVAIDESMGMACRLRLADLVLTVLVHAMSRLDPRVGVSVYVKLRSHSGRRPRISHKAMFESLPDDEERARLLNFLYREGEQNPVQYIERFGQYFAAAEHLRFESKEAGFRVKPPG